MGHRVRSQNLLVPPLPRSIKQEEESSWKPSGADPEKIRWRGPKKLEQGTSSYPPPPSPLLKPNEKFRTKDGWSMVLALRRDALNYSAYLRKQLENLSQRLLSCFLRRWLLSVAILKNYPERTLGTRLTNVTKRDGR